MTISTVIIVGAGPSGLATAACLTRHSIPYVLLERDDCHASLWKKYTYDRLHLHLSKNYVQFPYVKLPKNYPKYVSKHDFIQYIDKYVALFGIKPLYRRLVEGASFDRGSRTWRVVARNDEGGGCVVEEYVGRFLVVASGEACDPFRPQIDGLASFAGKVMHSTEYRCGKGYDGKSVLVVGCGNSGMEIALDLVDHGARVSMVVRSPVHILSRGMVWIGLCLLKYLSYNLVDNLMVLLSKLVYGDVTKYGLCRPSQGPFYLKDVLGKYPVVDIGAYRKIKSREIQVLPAIANIRGDSVSFQDGRSFFFDTIVLATGFKRSTNKWLQGDDYLLMEDGMPKPKYPDHWKGKDGLYCVGLARQGIYGLTMDAHNIARDISAQL